MSKIFNSLLVAVAIAMSSSAANAQNLFAAFFQNPYTKPSTREVVANPGIEPGTIVVFQTQYALYYAIDSQRALRYTVGVGRQGFMWTGTKTVSRKAEWPDWTPPEDMIRRSPYLPRWQAGGPSNPLGARAMYLGDTMYRIHGTNVSTSVGQNVSSGCIRMTNDDVTDLYSHVKVGTRVTVR